MKNGTLIAIIIGILAVFLIGAYYQHSAPEGYPTFVISVGENFYSLSCADALNNYYHGAQTGTCIASALNANKYTFRNAPQTLYKVVSAVESERYGPTGLQKTCKITISRDYSACIVAKSSFGDLECVNGYCDYADAVQIPDNCNSGDCLTISDNSHVICLANGKYSGVLSGVCQTSCIANWQCGSWSTCISGGQSRSCTDSKNCNDLSNKPLTAQSCIMPCTPSWNCGSWSVCSNSLQTRSCTDSNSCGVTTNMPLTSQGCTPTCTPNWQTGDWSTCSSGTQTRTVTDSNTCGVTNGKPVTSQNCKSDNPFGDIFNDPIIWWIIGGIVVLIIVVLLFKKK